MISLDKVGAVPAAGALRLIYSTCIETIRVQVRDGSDNTYHIEVQRNGIPVNTSVLEGDVLAMRAADILRDIYYHELDLILLAH